MAYPMQEQTAGNYSPPQQPYPEPVATYPPTETQPQPQQQGYPGQPQPAYPQQNGESS